MKNKFWIAVISKEHTIKATELEILQVCHGKKAPLKRIKKNDYIIIYSSKIKINDKKPYQKFTAVAKALDENVYQIKMFDNFEPFRRKVKFLECSETPIRPLIYELDFIINKKKWGYPFRFGLLEITKKDFDLITTKMLLKNE